MESTIAKLSDFLYVETIANQLQDIAQFDGPLEATAEVHLQRATDRSVLDTFVRGLELRVALTLIIGDMLEAHPEYPEHGEMDLAQLADHAKVHVESGDVHLEIVAEEYGSIKARLRGVGGRFEKVRGKTGLELFCILIGITGFNVHTVVVDFTNHGGQPITCPVQAEPTPHKRYYRGRRCSGTAGGTVHSEYDRVRSGR